MPRYQTPSKHPNTPQNPHHTDSTNKSFTTDSEERSQKHFSSDDQPHRNLIALLWRFSLSFFSLFLLVITLWQFSKRQPLSKWEQRWFNLLSILFSGSASLGLGSLFGYLGSMLRWPLLTQTIYKIQDVDSILGMSPPAGSLRLIKQHIQEMRISRTTFIVTLYLITNVLGRLSVAIFGLAYNMMDKTGIEYPILATNWTSASWSGNFNTTIDLDEGHPLSSKGAEEFSDSVWNGLEEFAQIPQWINSSGSYSDWQPLYREDCSYLVSGLEVSNSTLKSGTNTVEYSYQLKDFQEDYTILSNRTVYSTVTCSLIQVEKYQYWRWNNWDRTGPFNLTSDRYSTDIAAGALWASNSSRSLLQDVFVLGPPAEWVLSLNNSNQVKFLQIYITCKKLAWECQPILTEISTHEPYQIQPHERFFHPTNLYWGQELGDDILSYSYGFPIKFYVGKPNARTFGPAVLDGLDIICKQNLSIPLNKASWNNYTLWVSGLVARLPILAIQHANTALPRYTRDTHSNQTAGTAYLHTTLEVNWQRITIIAVSILVGQILAILAVLHYSKGVYTRDDSHLATAELLKTVINQFDGGKLMTGEELAASLDRILGVSVSYGTREGKDGGPPEVDLASGMNANFPSFSRKPRFWRKQWLKKPRVAGMGLLGSVRGWVRRVWQRVGNSGGRFE